MSLGALYQQDIDRALDARVRAPLPPPAAPKREERSLWGVALRGITAGASQFFADVTSLQIEEDPPERQAVRRRLSFVSDEAQRITDEQRASAEAARAAMSTSARDFAAELRPDPSTAGLAENIVFQASRGLSKAAGAVVTLGPIAGAAAFGGSEATATLEEMKREGVDDETARKAAAVSGVAGAAGVLLPMIGPSVRATLGLYAVGGPGAFVAQQAATREVLERANYFNLAQQFDPLDPVGLAVSAIIPLPFAAWGVRGSLRAAAAASVKPGATRVEPTLEPATPVPAATSEQLDAAMVHNLTLVREATRAAAPSPGALPELARARLPAIAPARNLSASDRAIETRLADKLLTRFDEAVVEYSGLKDSDGGKVLSTDIARELSPEYIADRTKSAAVHEPASWFIKRLYERMLAEPAKPGEAPLVLVTAGGTGAGKTTAIANVPAMKGLKDAAQIVYDTNMNKYESAKERIDQALAAGKDVAVAYVYRDPVEALTRGALTRAERQRREFGTGRTVPLAEHLKTHTGAAEVVPRLASEYAGNPRVQFVGVDNSLGEGKAVPASVAALVAKAENSGASMQALRAALEQEREAGRISEETYRGFLEGEVADGAGARRDAASRAHAVDGAHDGGQPAGSGLAGRPVGRSDTAITEHGLTVPVRYRLAEVADLTTSHGDDLAPNPAFPERLQPRDRSRAASADQVARIANDIRPELLGASAKASDGAPIIGADGLVESGNARTIALRRAYGEGKAEHYRAWLEANADQFGLKPEDVRGMQRPVLVRERTGDVDRAEFMRQANESPVARMSPSEQARADAARLSDLEGLVPRDDGTINAVQSAPFIRRFMQAVGPTERGELMQADGSLSQAGQQRLRNAIFARAYGNTGLLAALSESTDSNIRNILAGLVRAAPAVAKLRDLVGAGARQPIDVAGRLVRAVQEFEAVRERGMTVQQALSQGDLLGTGLPPELNNLLVGLAENARAPRRIAEMVQQMVRAVDELGDPRQGSLMARPSEADLTADVVERLRTITDAQLTDQPAHAIKPSTDPLMRSVGERVQALEAMAPELTTRLDADGKPVSLADDLAAVRREAAEGTDADLGAMDAELLRVAAQCALAVGGGA